MRGCSDDIRSNEKSSPTLGSEERLFLEFRGVIQRPKGLFLINSKPFEAYVVEQCCLQSRRGTNI